MITDAISCVNSGGMPESVLRWDKGHTTLDRRSGKVLNDEEWPGEEWRTAFQACRSTSAMALRSGWFELCAKSNRKLCRGIVICFVCFFVFVFLLLCYKDHSVGCVQNKLLGVED